MGPAGADRLAPLGAIFSEHRRERWGILFIAPISLARARRLRGLMLAEALVVPGDARVASIASSTFYRDQWRW